MTILLDYTKEELTEIVLGYGQPKFRAEQLYNALYNGKDYEDKMNLPKNFIEKLQEGNMILQPIKIYKVLKSKSGTTKFLYLLPDGNIIEGVLMEYKFGNTICVSTQVGCKMNCAFCASGLNGFIRNLSAGEIIGQVVAVNKYLSGTVKDRKITNIVLMGSGEPLDNYANTLKFLTLATNKDGFNFSVRNISLSTSGIPSKIEALADSGYHITLSISLHAPNNEIRREIMPIARRYSIESVLEAAKYYNTITNRRILIEYILVDKVNNSTSNAKELATLLKDLPCHVNLIKLNEVDGRVLKTPSIESCNKFLETLNKLQISATLRRTLGDDVEGACGQLRNSELKKNNK